MKSFIAASITETDCFLEFHVKGLIRACKIQYCLNIAEILRQNCQKLLLQYIVRRLIFH